MKFLNLATLLLSLFATTSALAVGKRQTAGLQIYVANAACLESEDAITSTDPYIEITVDGQTQRTQKVGDGTTFTIYGETLNFPSASPTSVLDIVAKDKDVLRDDTIGKATVDLSKVDTTKPITVELKHLLGLANAGIVTIYVVQ
ncbi:hypothetical protein HK097_000797 [Rhizophlyctis rosea]|uniref:C2 domain-containing protein n=1 Tax=Rhizophlyctis rosea TaxID=64517 RepID=A0AAD5WZA2_9FUNG|nr:hypothetical protein HK097_000797 [Rhizophlyctis rosea]